MTQATTTSKVVHSTGGASPRTLHFRAPTFSSSIKPSNIGHPAKHAHISHLARPMARQRAQSQMSYCTTEPPLKQEQIIALSDVVGSLKELVFLVLSAAAGEPGGADKMESAVDPRTARNIVEFLSEEWEIE
jgi:hypothetical protein